MNFLEFSLFNIFNPWLVEGKDAKSTDTEGRVYFPQETGLFLFFSPVKLIQNPITSQLNKSCFLPVGFFLLDLEKSLNHQADIKNVDLDQHYSVQVRFKIFLGFTLKSKNIYETIVLEYFT